MHTPSTVSCPRRETRPQHRQKPRSPQGWREGRCLLLRGCPNRVPPGRQGRVQPLRWRSVILARPPRRTPPGDSDRCRVRFGSARRERPPIRPARARLHSFAYRHESSAAERSSGHSSARERLATHGTVRRAPRRKSVPRRCHRTPAWVRTGMATSNAHAEELLRLEILVRHYLIATGLTGEPTAPWILRGGAERKKSYRPS